MKAESVVQILLQAFLLVAALYSNGLKYIFPDHFADQ